MKHAILRRAAKYNGNHPAFRQQVIADVMRRVPLAKEGTVMSSFTTAIAKLRQESPGLVRHIPDYRHSKKLAAGRAVPASRKSARVEKSGMVKIVAVRGDEEAKYEGILPKCFGWDDLDEHERVEWVRQVALGGVDFDQDCIYFQSPTGGAIRLDIVCQMSISDLCLAELHTAG